MNNNIENYEYKTIVFIGPEGKATWIGTEKGLRNEYPKAMIINTSPLERGCR